MPTSLVVPGPPTNSSSYGTKARSVSCTGRPGSGKTTVLWKAVEACSGQRVLYLTWSRELTAAAEEHFRAFVPADVRVDARDFATFLGEVCGSDVDRRPLSAGRQAFATATARLGRRQVGPWADRDAALHAEVRAILLGRAVPGDTDSIPAGDLVRLSDTAYRDRRAGDDGVGRAAASALLKVAGTVEPDAFTRIFPELAAATAAIARLRDDELPEGFEKIDRVVDEVQDLTVIETRGGRRAVSGDHTPAGTCALTAGSRRRRTDRTSVRLRLGLVERPAGRAPRCTAPVPSRRQPALPEPHRGGHRARVGVVRPPRQGAAPDQAASPARRPARRRPPVPRRGRCATAVGLLEQLDDVEGVVILRVGDELPAWVPERLRDVLLTPADAKGLEYQSVCVLDPGRALARLDAATGPTATRTSQALPEHEHRTAIDQFRVALSRATETLAFVDIAGDDDARALSAELLEDAAPYDADDLVEHFADDSPPDERVQARTHDARALIDTAPGRAWQRACQAMRLLGGPHLPNGVSDQTVRQDARTTLLATAARLLVDGIPARVHRHEVIRMAGEAILSLDASDRHAHALHALDAWTLARETAPFVLLDTALALESDRSWLRPALPPVAQRLRDAVETFAEEPAEASAYAGDVEGWLKLTGYAGDAAAKARALRCRAVDTVTDAGETAGRRARRSCSPSSRRTARVWAGCAKCRDAWKTPPRRSRPPGYRRTPSAIGAAPASGSRPCGWPRDRSEAIWNGSSSWTR